MDYKQNFNLLSAYYDRYGLFITLKSGAWLCRQKFAQDFTFKIHLFIQNVLQSYASNIYRHLFETLHYPIRHRGCFIYILNTLDSASLLVKLKPRIF
jgi:hypothetical protein